MSTFSTITNLIKIKIKLAAIKLDPIETVFNPFNITTKRTMTKTTLTIIPILINLLVLAKEARKLSNV